MTRVQVKFSLGADGVNMLQNEVIFVQKPTRKQPCFSSFTTPVPSTSRGSA